jgi:hypothetical protein
MRTLDEAGTAQTSCDGDPQLAAQQRDSAEQAGTLMDGLPTGARQLCRRRHQPSDPVLRR